MANHEFNFNVAVQENVSNLERLLDRCSNRQQALNNAILKAAYYSNVETLKRLVTMGADITYDNNKALEYAVLGEKLDNVKYIYETGKVNPAEKNLNNLMQAIENLDVDMILYLLSLDEVKEKLDNSSFDQEILSDLTIDVISILVSDNHFMNAIMSTDVKNISYNIKIYLACKMNIKTEKEFNDMFNVM
jgi:hypothetical protein